MPFQYFQHVYFVPCTGDFLSIIYHRFMNFTQKYYYLIFYKMK